MSAWKTKHRWRLVTYDEQPEWKKDNEFIHGWYREPTPSIRACLRSIFRIHNQTGNIWTHLVPLIAFSYAAAVLILQSDDYYNDSIIERIIYGFLFFGMCACFAFSTAYQRILKRDGPSF